MIPIYISRRCQNCQELLILIHQQKGLHQRFSIIDIDTNPYPNYLQVVPTMVHEDSLINGQELFKYIHILIDKLQERVSPPLENNPQTVQSNTVDVKPEEKEKKDEILGFCMDGSCSLDFSSLEDDEYIDNRDIYENLEGEIQTNPESLRENVSEKKQQVNNDLDQLLKERSMDIVPQSS